MSGPNMVEVPHCLPFARGFDKASTHVMKGGGGGEREGSSLEAWYDSVMLHHHYKETKSEVRNGKDSKKISHADSVMTQLKGYSTCCHVLFIAEIRAFLTGNINYTKPKILRR